MLRAAPMPLLRYAVTLRRQCHAMIQFLCFRHRHGMQ